MNHNAFDTIVVGAGHAGVEACLATARMGLKTLVLCLNPDTIGLVPCNPSIGGPGKGHLVREIDALGGEMARNIDHTYINIRWLNTSRGPAVRSLRAQADKKLYSLRLKHVLEHEKNVYIRHGLATDLLFDGKSIKGIEIDTGERFYSPAVILTTGTFLSGLIHIGEKTFPSGRLGEFPAIGLSECLRNIGIEMGRLKTGTVARVNSDKIDYSKCIEQQSSPVPLCFSHFSTPRFPLPQTSCWLTRTNKNTHDIIQSNLDKAPLFTGQIKGVGPRYCPSIEDKIFRFPERSSHHLFLEPEGAETSEVYIQGLSSSLPVEVQKQFINSVEGLERVDIIRPGYAVEYDIIIPTQLDSTLAAMTVKGLYSAGQINGTSGYEEAAAQGIIAGINAAAYVRGLDPLVVKRNEGYIGVLIDDIITRDTVEPYRVFTSGNEYRLSTRFDNADVRFGDYGYKYGLLSEEQHIIMNNTQAQMEQEIKHLKMFHVKQSRGHSALIGKSLYQALKTPEISFSCLSAFNEEFIPTSNSDVRQRVETEIKYEGYLLRQKKEIDDFLKHENIFIPEAIDYASVTGISTEARIKFSKLRPSSIGHASRIQGISPSDVTYLLYYIRKHFHNCC